MNCTAIFNLNPSFSALRSSNARFLLPTRPPLSRDPSSPFNNIARNRHRGGGGNLTVPVTACSLQLPLLPFDATESLLRKKFFVHFVLDPISASNTSAGTTFVARYGCLVVIENVERLDVGALVSIRGIGRVKGTSQGQHYGGFGGAACYGVWGKTVPFKSRRQYRSAVKCFCSPTDQKVRLVEEVEISEKSKVSDSLVSGHGWRVRRLVEEAAEMKEVAFIQAQAFHVPVALFDDYFFTFFQAEVLSALIYKLKSSPPDRYACLVAESGSDDTCTSPEGLVGVVDVTTLRDYDVLQHLQGADEYLYISGLAVLKSFRRRKIATVLLQACEALSILWGVEYLALRAYEDDEAAQELYTNAGYGIVAGDPPWFSTWIGRRRRVIMIKRCGLGVSDLSREPSL